LCNWNLKPLTDILVTPITIFMEGMIYQNTGVWGEESVV